MSKKMKQVFYDYQLVKDIDEHGLEAFPNEGLDSEEEVIENIEDSFGEMGFSDITLEVVIYKVEILKTIKVTINSTNTVIVKK
jgi:hypothetical protein